MSDDDQQISSVKWVWFGILAGLVVLVGASTYFILPTLILNTASNVKVVRALQEPIKVKPAFPGGKIVDHQDLLVVDILKGGTEPSDQTETLVQNSSNPEPPPISLTENPAPKITPNTEKTEVVRRNQDLKTVDQAQKTPLKSLPIGKNQKKLAGENSLAVKKDNGTKAVKKNSLKGNFGKDQGIKSTGSIIKKRSIIIEEAPPLYMIQLAAFRSAEKADEMAKILSQKHKSRLNDIDLETMRVNTGNNGVFHRIVSAPLPRKGADKMCSILRRSGQDCFIRKYAVTNP